MSAGRLAELESELAARGVVARQDAVPTAPVVAQPAVAAGVRQVDVSRLDPSPRNIREVGDVSELAASIRVHGVLQALTAASAPGGRYTLIFGHRRLAAAKQAGLDTVPVDVRPEPGIAKGSVLRVVENFHRQDMSAIEKAEALGDLRDGYGWSAAGIAEATGLAPSTVSRYLTLLELDEESRQRVKDGTVKVGDALNAVLDARAERRRPPAPGRSGQPVKPRPASRPVRREAPWLTGVHELAGRVARICDHPARPVIGDVGCGQCWEQAIRADERARAASS